MAHVINLSATLLYVQPATSRVLLNVGINVATSGFVAAESDIACAQCCKYSAALIVAKLLLENHECVILDNSDKNADFCAQVNQDMLLISAFILLNFVHKSNAFICHGITGVASVHTPYVNVTVDHLGAQLKAATVESCIPLGFVVYHNSPGRRTSSPPNPKLSVHQL